VTVHDWVQRRLERPPEDEGAEPTFISVGEQGRPRGSQNESLKAIRGLGGRLRGLGLPETPERRAVVVVDDLKPEVGHALFGRARDELWGLPLTWVVIGDEARRADYLRPPADAFFTKVVDVPPLSTADALKVLRSRAPNPLPPGIAQRSVEQAEGNPRRLLSLAADVLVGEGEDAGSALSRERAITARLRELGAPAERMWATLVPLGQASAHDPELLDRLGWSRARASQVLNQLEAAGLVASSTERAQQGRPRKVYRVASRRPDEE